jgi:N-succinyl-L-ornithine transcarbamylase
MKTYTNVKDLGNLQEAIKEALEIKKDRYAYKHIGENKTLLMVFFNSRISPFTSTVIFF